MFGRFTKVVQGSVLAGLCVYVIRLYFADTINLYIHPRYSIFALVMSLIGLVLLGVWLVLAIRKRLFRPVSRPAWPTIVVDSLVVLLLIFAFALPAKPLSSQAVERKTANIPRSSQESNAPSTVRDCLSRTPQSLQEWVVQLDAFPNPDCYKDAAVSVTGFIYESPDQPLPDGYLYVARLVMSCCVVDARPYALPVQTNEPLAKDSWVRIEGKVAERTIDGVPRLVVVPNTITPVEQPKDVYGY